MSKMMMAMQDHQQQIEERMNDLANVVNRKMDDIVNELNKKFDETGQKKTEVETQRQSLEAETQKRMEHKVDELMDKVKQKMEASVNMGDVVSSKLEEDQEELEEIRRRRTSVIIHGLKESADDNVEMRKQEDENQVINMLHNISCDTISVSSLIRLGIRQDDPVKNTRTLKITLASEKQKEQILRCAKNVRGKKDYETTYIHQDRTPRQRLKRRQLVAVLQERQEAGERNLIIVNNKIVTRRWRPEEKMRLTGQVQGLQKDRVVAEKVVV